MKVEQLFASHQVSGERKEPLATLSFLGNAMYWWTSLERERRIKNAPQVQYWNDLKSALRRIHIPSYYHRELMDKLQRLHQNNMKVEEYRQNMELYIDQGRTQPNKTNKCSIRELTQGSLPVTIIFNQRFQIQQRRGVWLGRFSSNTKLTKHNCKI